MLNGLLNTVKGPIGLFLSILDACEVFINICISSINEINY